MIFITFVVKALYYHCYITGAVKEATGLYVYSIRLCLLLYIPAGILLLLSVMMQRCCGMRKERQCIASKTEVTRL